MKKNANTNDVVTPVGSLPSVDPGKLDDQPKKTKQKKVAIAVNDLSMVDFAATTSKATVIDQIRLSGTLIDVNEDGLIEFADKLEKPAFKQLEIPGTEKPIQTAVAPVLKQFPAYPSGSKINEFLSAVKSTINNPLYPSVSIGNFRLKRALIPPAVSERVPLFMSRSMHLETATNALALGVTVDELIRNVLDVFNEVYKSSHGK